MNNFYSALTFCKAWKDPVGTRVPSNGQVFFCLALAALFWFVLFGLQLVNFWLGMAVAATTLAVLGSLMAGLPWNQRELSTKAVLLGLFSALLLYGLFWVGYAISQHIFPFSRAQVGDIYAIRDEAKPALIAVVLLFITSPAEELFWRGFVQRWAMHRLGIWPGWLLAAAIYGAVHLFSGNLMLTLAALVAGLFWGLLYAISGSMTACIVSHAVWTAGIFVFFPIAI